MILFGLVALELRTLACMGFHYVFLVGLALWDTAATAATAATAEKAAVPAGNQFSILNSLWILKSQHECDLM